MSQDNTIFISGMEQMLKGHGFEDVHVEAVPTPQYLKDYEKKELAEIGSLATEEEPKNTAPQYYRVATKQGIFGIIMGEYLLVDLTGTGIPLSEFIPEEDVADLPPDIPPCIEFEDSEQLLLLWQLLTKKKAQP